MRIKSGIWVAAQIKQCDIEFRPAVVRQRGDADSGSILLRLDRLNGRSSVLTQIYDAQGQPCWLKATGTDDVEDNNAEEYIQRRMKQDPDIWVVEIEDPNGTYKLDAPIVT